MPWEIVGRSGTEETFRANLDGRLGATRIREILGTQHVTLSLSDSVGARIGKKQ